ncbi:MAG TPA: zf-HC2 domain-containing protein [Terracidiphilus sp.]|nr:zf-HC2 domain-containing protein [Terracidiphilus sp.]
MPDHTSNGMQCNEFEHLLADAIDGALSGTGLGRFQAHARVCRTCGPLLAEAEAGRNWLKGLTEVEPPASLVNNILASTTGVDTQRLRVTARSAQLQISSWERVQATLSEWLIQPIWGMVRQPRFAMSFGMAFFALSVGLTVAGVKPQDLSQISLRPKAIQSTYFHAQARVVHYYENIHFVYEMESRVREIRRSVAPAEPAPAKKDNKNNTTQQPEQKQERNYSQTENQIILASAPVGPSVFGPQNPDLPVVPVTTDRRFV